MATALKDVECDDEQDYDDFNIQSPPPYDVIERVKEANRLLEEDETPIEKIKSPRVKFKEHIVEFEVELSDLSSDDATDDWMTPQLRVKEEEEGQQDKTLLGSESDDDDISLMPLEEEVKLGFPHQATYKCEDGEESPPLEYQSDLDAFDIEKYKINHETNESLSPLVILVPRESEFPVGSDRSDNLRPSITETFAPSSPISDDVPDTCDGLSLSTDNTNSKLETSSPVTELDISEEFQLSLDLNKQQIVEESDAVKTSIKISLQTFPSISISNQTTNSIEDSLQHAKRKDSLKLQHYRKSLEGPISSEWNQFQTVTDGLTPRDTSEHAETVKLERPSSSRASIGITLTSSVRDRPWTAPNSRRTGSKWSGTQLPSYNGMRSEYGLSLEQLEERKRLRKKLADERREKVKRKQDEETERRDQNERVFRAWLARKQAENSLEGGVENGEFHKLSSQLRKEQAEECFKQWLQRKKHERKSKQRLDVERTIRNHEDLPYKSEESQLAFKQWVKSKSKRAKKHNKRIVLNNDPATLQKILNNLDPHTKSTFRIYLGVSKIEISHKKKKFPESGESKRK